MIDRGNCTFVRKVRNVENAGGHVALIIDNKYGEEVDQVIMADDGYGRNITIPGLLISKKDGDIIANYMGQYKDAKVVLEVDFEMEHKNNTVRYDLYFTSDNEAVYKLLQEFYYYHLEIMDSTNFTVHYVTYQSPYYVEGGKNTENVKNCIAYGKYCNSPGKFGNNDGTVVVKENIKQKCVYKYAYENPDKKNYYWDYMVNFYNTCLNGTKFTQECSMGVSQDVGIPNDIINKCIHDSYINADMTNKNWMDIYSNRLLDEDNNNRRVNLISFIPSIIVNGRTLSGSWRADNLFEAICAGYKKKPEVCYSEGAFTKSSKMSWLSVWLIVILIIIVNVIIFTVCKNYIRKKIVDRIESTDINHKINTVVTSYLALRENK